MNSHQEALVQIQNEILPQIQESMLEFQSIEENLAKAQQLGEEFEAFKKQYYSNQEELTNTISEHVKSQFETLDQKVATLFTEIEALSPTLKHSDMIKQVEEKQIDLASQLSHIQES